MITATQEDVDLLVAYKSADRYQVIMLEAKGVTPHANGPFQSKVKRLTAIFGSSDAPEGIATPHFLLVSPRRSLGLDYSTCPPWMLRPDGKVAWFKLPLLPKLKKVVRCQRGGEISNQGDHWKVILEPLSGLDNWPTAGSGH